MKAFCWLVSLFIFVHSMSLLAQVDERKFVLSNSHLVKMKSDITGRDHELVIFLPNSYETQPEKRYPVLYFVDAYWDAPMMSAIHGNLVWDNVIPELIMVGFSYAGENPNYDDLRRRDLTPTKIEGANSGDGAKFLRYIETTVIPYMDSNYRTQVNERALSGNSLGGLFALYAMYEKPQLFKRFIAVSPAASWDNNYLFHRDDDYAKNNKSFPVRLFLSQGGDEYSEFRNPIVALQKQLASRNYQDFALLNYTIEGGRHTGVKAEGYNRGVQWVFKDIAPTGPSGLEKSMRGLP